MNGGRYHWENWPHHRATGLISCESVCRHRLLVALVLLLLLLFDFLCHHHHLACYSPQSLFHHRPGTIRPGSYLSSPIASCHPAARIPLGSSYSHYWLPAALTKQATPDTLKYIINRQAQSLHHSLLPHESALCAQGILLSCPALPLTCCTILANLLFFIYT